MFELFESGVTLFQNLDKHGKIVYNDLVYNTIIQYAFKFGFIGELGFLFCGGSGGEAPSPLYKETHR